ncbi:hypothetical protein Kpol_1037p50 [Vanderwaltozyma polyspora DSM 70294]|uniref:Thioredoxin domain-containing protein n=1 Tax=Vanderwaltozyma polyspora (strain ATCC 22028 / DSM 70294 / BCRC 21397 / CBS 2163 / NBRC 10782 / NRRL Y-8283 / UCD 57-17) TaxID=436907 RepID=A7TJZ1_VANPO|nr:uncharacterized protein Kpol_1037p50 [Vanderwaltozyma polyspora DSM 70294]EDO17453.1 hypothetical protein Kpol_1037p50 [Vanderwaltozyma polyspora DSM 70294]
MISRQILSRPIVGRSLLLRSGLTCRPVLGNSCRLLHSFRVLKQKENDNDKGEIVFKSKKPLSRIPIGGSFEKQSNSANGDRKPIVNTASGTIEFSTWKAALLFIVVGSGLYFIFEKEKKRLEVEREAEANRGYGKPVVGGPFSLINCSTGDRFNEENLNDNWSIIYFGFTHCPDICPDELDKLGVWLNSLKTKFNIKLQPIFITCDPARDTPEVMENYLKDFHPDIVGLTGSYDEIKNTCKQYRVYFSTPPNLKPGQDYLVDHSVFFYLMDPEGQFVQVLGMSNDEVTGVDKIKELIDGYVPSSEREKRKGKWYSFLFE